MNRTEFIGNLTADPEQRAVSDTAAVTNFTVAVNERTRTGTITTFYRVSAWGKLGDVCRDNLHKSSKVRVSGTVSARAFIGQDGNPRASLEVRAREVEFLTPRPRDNDGTEYAPMN